MHQYSIGVAIFDFLPVALTALALTFLVRAVAVLHHGVAPVARIAALLIPFGGLCKASWKLIVATSGQHITWLENLLFICMAPGFVMLAFCLYHARVALRDSTPPATAQYSPIRLLLWLSLPLVGCLLVVFMRPETRLWFFWLLGITTIANATLIFHAFVASQRIGLTWSAPSCFIYNFCATLALSGLSRLPQSDTTAWIQEGVNFSAQAALAIGFWIFSREVQQKIRSTATA